MDVAVAVSQASVYTVTINGEQYNYTSADGDEADVIRGLKAAITNSEYVVTVEDGNTLRIVDTVKTRNNTLVLSDNLTTRSVTTIAQFLIRTDFWGQREYTSGIFGWWRGERSLFLFQIPECNYKRKSVQFIPQRSESKLKFRCCEGGLRS